MSVRIVFIIFLFFTLPAFSQNLITGYVYDLKTKQAIPFANITLKETSVGTISDIDGYFSMNTKHFPCTLQISYIGYETTVYVVSSTPTKPVYVYIKPRIVELPEITIKAGENPAHRLIRKVIELKERNNPEQLNSFTYVSYNKLVFTIDKKSSFVTYDTIKTNPEKAQKYPQSTLSISDSLPSYQLSQPMDSFFNKHYLFLSESVSRRHFLYPNNNKEEVIATRTSGISQPYFILLATQFQSFSFYSDFVSILDKKYLNPFSKQAIGRYFYEITDTLYNELSDTIFVLFFRPLKNTLFDGLKGTVHINSRLYAIQSIKAEPAQRESMFHIRIQQLYNMVEQKQWFPVQLNTEFYLSTLQLQDKNDTLKISDTTLLVVRKNIPLVGIGKSYLDSIEINPPLSRKAFSSVSMELKSNAHLATDSLWNRYRMESFGEKEFETYRLIDSIGKEAKLDNKLQAIEILLSGYIPANWVKIGIYNLFDYNRFEGFRTNLDLQTCDKFSRQLGMGGFIGYGVNDKEIKYGAQGWFKPNPFKDFMIKFQYKKDVREIGEINFLEDRSVFNNDNFRRIYINRMDYQIQYAASVQFRLMNYFKYQLFISKNTLTLHPEYYFNYNDSTITTVEYNEAVLSLKFLYKEEFFQTLKGRYSIGSKYPSLFINLHVGQIFVLNTYYWKSEMKCKIPIDLGIYGKSTITLMTGYTPYTLPVSLLYSGKGTKFLDLSIYADNTFTTMNVYEFFYNQYAFAFFKHNFGKILFRIKKWQPTFSVHHNIAIGDIKKSTLHTVHSTNRLYTESGFLINGILSQSLNNIGIGLFYRYGNYILPSFKENIAIKLSVSFSL